MQRYNFFGINPILGLCLGLEFPSAYDMDYETEDQQTIFCVVIDLFILRIVWHIYDKEE